MNESVPENPAAGVYVYEPSAATLAVPCAGCVFETTLTPVPLSFASTPSAAPFVTAVPVVVVAVSGAVATCVARTVFAKVTTTSVPSALVALGKSKLAVLPSPWAMTAPELTFSARQVVA